jgi:hypothetical protein
LLYYVASVNEAGQLTFTWQPVSYLLATPLPLGIPILAWHAASNKNDGVKALMAKWRARVRGVIKAARKWQAKAREAQALAEARQAEINQLQEANKRLQERNRSQQDIIRAWQALPKDTQALARFRAEQITDEEAARIIGVKDVRTVHNRAERLNGVAK